MKKIYFKRTLPSIVYELFRMSFDDNKVVANFSSRLSKVTASLHIAPHVSGRTTPLSAASF